MIKAHGISAGYGGATILHDVTFATRPGEVVGLIGPNGSGKTTLLRTLTGSLPVTAGTVTIDGTPLTSLTAKQRARRLAVVVQDAEPDVGFTAAEMVLLGRSPHKGAFQRHDDTDARIAEGALAQVGALTLGTREFSSLSGGERQRILIARALAQGSEYVLLDEPTNHLDVRYQHEILHLVRQSAVTAVVVLHDLNLAAQYCDRVVLLDAGRVRVSGTPDDVLTASEIEPVYGVGIQRVETVAGIQVLTHRLVG